MVHMETGEIVDGLIELQDKYAHVFRAIITKERYNNIVNSGVLSEFRYDDKVLREPLLEHVGHLPIIAAYLYPFIEHKKEVDLGRALIMISIHDIGETVTGDILTYDKSSEHEKKEYEAVKQLLDSEMFAIFDEYEKRETLEAKYAKSVDAVAPLLHEMTLPEITFERFKFYNFDLVKIDDAKRKYFEWDSVMMKIFEELLERYKSEVENKS